MDQTRPHSQTGDTSAMKYQSVSTFHDPAPPDRPRWGPKPSYLPVLHPGLRGRRGGHHLPGPQTIDVSLVPRGSPDRPVGAASPPTPLLEGSCLLRSHRLAPLPLRDRRPLRDLGSGQSLRTSRHFLTCVVRRGRRQRRIERKEPGPPRPVHRHRTETVHKARADLKGGRGPRPFETAFPPLMNIIH